VVQAKRYLRFAKATVAQGMVYSFLWSDVTVVVNKEEALKYFDSVGLIDGKLERGTSHYNNRTHVWLLSGKKPVVSKNFFLEESV
jgi:hypothetical protein